MTTAKKILEVAIILVRNDACHSTNHAIETAAKVIGKRPYEATKAVADMIRPELGDREYSIPNAHLTQQIALWDTFRDRTQVLAMLRKLVATT